MYSGGNIEVSIVCFSYNHEKFLRQCLDGMLMQKTDFLYEILVHDDCSTDTSQDIIREYEKKYPDRIIALMEEENRFSKGLDFVADLYHQGKGKYLAVCEGDDYWSDPTKLQKQYDFMESHKDFSLCTHNSVIHDLTGESADRNFFEPFPEEYRVMTQGQIFDDWMVHTSSYFFRNDHEIYPEWCLDYFSGDYALMCVAYTYGKIAVLPDVMSVYNYQNKEGVTYKHTRDTGVIDKIRERKTFLEHYLEHVHLDTEAEKTVRSRMDAIEESTTASELCLHMIDMKSSRERDEVKLRWLESQLNSEILRKWCFDPSVGVENRIGMTSRTTLFSTARTFIGTLKDIRSTLHFSFVPWMVKIYTDEACGKEFIYGVAAHPDNQVGWGVRVRGNAAERKEALFSVLQGRLAEEGRTEELNECKIKALEKSEEGVFEECLSELCRGLDIFPLDAELILYKAFVLYNLDRYEDALDEIGIYSLLYGMDGDAEGIYKSIISDARL